MLKVIFKGRKHSPKFSFVFLLYKREKKRYFSFFRNSIKQSKERSLPFTKSFVLRDSKVNIRVKRVSCNNGNYNCHLSFFFSRDRNKKRVKEKREEKIEQRNSGGERKVEQGKGVYSNPFYKTVSLHRTKSYFTGSFTFST